MRCISFLLLSWAFVSAGYGGVLVVAHRGGAALGAENTLSCMEAAIAAGAGALEVDVHLTKDGHIVVCHDATVDATTNGRGRISRMSLREVQALRVVDNAGRVTSDSIPTLEQVLQLAKGRCRVLVEVKRSSGAGLEERLVELVEAHDASQWVSVQSFSDAVLRRLRALGAPFALEKLVVFKVPLLPLVFDGGLRFFSLKKYAYVSSFNFHKRCLPASLARRLQRVGKVVKVWTLRSPDEAPRASVDAVIVDNPTLWREP